MSNLYSDDLLAQLDANTQIIAEANQEIEFPEGGICTDTANSERFARQHKDKVKYCMKTGKWYCWDGKRWKEDETGLVYNLAEDTARSIFSEVIETSDPDEVKRLSSWGSKSLMQPRIEAMLKLASTHRSIAIEIKQFDSDPMLFNCHTGTIDLRTGECKPHNKKDMITKISPVEFDSEVTCVKFIKFLKEIFENDDELINFILSLFGYCLTGSTQFDIFVIFWGSGANGKSTLITTVQTLMGDYAKSAARDVFITKNLDSHPTGLADLAGARLVTTVETDENKKLAEALIKQTSGGDRIKARFMRQDFFEFDPTFKVILITNHKPIIHGTDHAIWRRVLLVPFTVQIPKEKQDKSLRIDKFRDEWPGILNLFIKGYLEWQKEGIKIPRKIIIATKEYKSESDIINDWMMHRAVQETDIKTPAKDLYEDYKSYCDTNGDTPASSTLFGRKLAEKGFQKKHFNGKIHRIGIRIKKSTEENDDTTSIV